MYHLNDFITKINKKGKKIRKYRCFCDECGCDKGYMRSNRATLPCISCAQRHVTVRRYKQKFLNVDFDDYILISRSKRAVFKYRSYCSICGKDRGYLIKIDWACKCSKCSSIDITRRIAHSCTSQGIPVEEFTNFITPIRKAERERYVRSGLIKTCLQRDNFICQKCKQKKRDLRAHHCNSWDNFPHDRYNLDNLVCLCNTCHVLFHSMYGYGSNTLQQYKNFLTDAI